MNPLERRTAPSADDAGPGPLSATGRQGWEEHPGVRTGVRLSPGEHAADLVSRATGSWTYLIVVAVAAMAGATAAARSGGLAGLGAGLASLALVEVSLVLTAARRAERIAGELATYHLDQSRRATAVAEDLRAEMQRLHTDMARLVAYTDKVGQSARHR
jgi:hypothetical protein